MNKIKVLVIGRKVHPDGKETAAFIAESLKPYLETHNANVSFVALNELLFDISNEQTTVINTVTGEDIADADVVLMTNWFSHASIRKDMALTLALYLRDKGIPCFNSEAQFSRSTSKLSQMLIATQQGVRVPRTVFSLSLARLETYLERVNFSTPFILKDAQASRGRSNYMLKSMRDIDAHKSEHTESHPFLAQACVSSDGSDYRYFVVGGQTAVIIHRIGTGESHLNNTSAGASTEIIEADAVPKSTLEMVHTMSAALHREVTGIDIIIDRETNEAYFLEANPIPQIATGSNVALKLEALAAALVSAAKGEKA